MKMTEENYLAHYGILRRSGRYPWGSGETQSQRNKSFLDVIAAHRKAGMSDTEIARAYDMSTTQLRATKSIARNEQRQSRINEAQRLQDKGMSVNAIGKQMGVNESSIRALLAPGAKDKADVLFTTADFLQHAVDEKRFVEVGAGNEHHIGVSATQLNNAVALLKERGYEVHPVKIDQIATGKQTELKVLCPPGTTQKEVWMHRHEIQLPTGYSEDHGRTYTQLHDPINISADRVGIRYAEQGGTKADGVIYLRPGAEDLSLGKANYAQVRIAVDGTHYLKGMAFYKDDLPQGVDVLFNTNKSDTGNKFDAMKPQDHTDPLNPFGSSLRRQRGALNIVNEEGEWNTWRKNLPSQFLSKQRPDFAKSQLELTYDRRRAEFEKLSQLTNPVVKRTMLKTFAESVDSAAVHLHAAHMPRQVTKVILPIESIRETEVYCPSLKNGERVALVRFPHGGTFEIPQLTVNNRNPEARKVLGPQSTDAIGIHHTVAQRLSGADFDGDTVLVIPNNRGDIKSQPALEGLMNFDPQHSYPPYDGLATIDGGTYNAKTRLVDYGPKGKSGHRKQQLMGDVSNLITDMTIQGAPPSEVAQAVRHSMVIIDSEKHSLDYKSSHRDNGIPALKAKYQGRANAGASTLLSKAGAETRIDERKPRPAKDGGPIDRATGKLVFVPTKRTRTDRHGNRVPRQQVVERLSIEDDAHKLVSQPTGTPVERIYADHSNRLKALANQARKDSLVVPRFKRAPSAASTYAQQVSELDSALRIAERNAPLERQAQVVANATLAQKRQAKPGMEKEEIKKIKNQALSDARNRTGARKSDIVLTPQQWEAIQAGAISEHKLTRILQRANLDVVRELATPSQSRVMSPVMLTRARQMLDSGYTQADIADALGVPVSTLHYNIEK